MSNIYKGEFQDYEGNVVYPHTTADVVYTTDGKTVQSKLNQLGEGLDGVTGRTDSPEVDDSNILATSKAVHEVNQKLEGALKGINFNKVLKEFIQGGGSYTASENGYLVGSLWSDGGKPSMILDGVDITNTPIYNSTTRMNFCIPISKGTVITVGSAGLYPKLYGTK